MILFFILGFQLIFGTEEILLLDIASEFEITFQEIAIFKYDDELEKEKIINLRKTKIEKEVQNALFKIDTLKQWKLNKVEGDMNSIQKIDKQILNCVDLISNLENEYESYNSEIVKADENISQSVSDNQYSSYQLATDFLKDKKIMDIIRDGKIEFIKEKIVALRKHSDEVMTTIDCYSFRMNVLKTRKKEILQFSIDYVNDILKIEFELNFLRNELIKERKSLECLEREIEKLEMTIRIARSPEMFEILDLMYDQSVSESAITNEKSSSISSQKDLILEELEPSIVEWQDKYLEDEIFNKSLIVVEKFIKESDHKTKRSLTELFEQKPNPKFQKIINIEQLEIEDSRNSTKISTPNINNKIGNLQIHDNEFFENELENNQKKRSKSQNFMRNSSSNYKLTSLEILKQHLKEAQFKKSEKNVRFNMPKTLIFSSKF